jgi:hypothetical protein
MELTELQRTVVKKARKRIAVEARWCQGALARTAEGRKCRISDPAAVRFSAAGALIVEFLAELGNERRARHATKELACQLVQFPINLVFLNDQGEHRNVLELFDLALAK